jgi:hypothetical protein
VRALLIVALAGVVWQPQGPPGAGGSSGTSIAGLAVRITNNEPIQHARILLTKVDGGLSDSIVLSTDEQGRFGAVNVGPGTYRLFAEHEEHVRTESAAVTVGPGQPIRNVIVRMTPTGVITGRVVDELNDPVAKVYVRAATKDLTREAQTNDLGDYRIYGLPPGSYVLSASAYMSPRIEGGTYVIPTPPSPYSFGEGRGMIQLSGLLKTGAFIHPMALNAESHARVYYPDTTDPAQATGLELQPGMVLSGIDLRAR